MSSQQYEWISRTLMILALLSKMRSAFHCMLAI